MITEISQSIPEDIVLGGIEENITNMIIEGDKPDGGIAKTEDKPVYDGEINTEKTDVETKFLSSSKKIEPQNPPVETKKHASIEQNKHKEKRLETQNGSQESKK